MKRIYRAKEIDTYQEIISHTVEVSEVLQIFLNEKESFSFTVTLDNDTFINITREYQKSNRDEVYQTIFLLQKEFVYYTKHRNQKL